MCSKGNALVEPRKARNTQDVEKVLLFGLPPQQKIHPKEERMKYSFSDKHRAYMKKAYGSVMNVAEGAVRAGKTIDNVFVFAALLESSPDKFHLATGSTLGNAKLNLGDCNGLGLEHIFRGRCHWTRYKGNEALLVKTRIGERVVIFAGGKNADSHKKILGNSYGMWLATEINLHHSLFIETALSRQLASHDRRIFWDLNPTSPLAPIYSDHLDRYADMVKSGELTEDFYNYAHFTIRDNPMITEERLREITSQYDTASVWYRRDILGERCAAEGLIYRQFADSPSAFIVKSVDTKALHFIIIGIDFGGNRSKTTFVAVGFTRNKNELELTVLDEYAVQGEKGEISPETINKAAENFIRGLSCDYPGVNITYIFADSEAQYLINGMRMYLIKSGAYNGPFRDCKKAHIVDRIAYVNSLLARGKLKLHEKCKLLAAGLASAVWDESDGKKDKRLDNFTSDIDILDAFEYAIERYM